MDKYKIISAIKEIKHFSLGLHMCAEELMEMLDNLANEEHGGYSIYEQKVESLGSVHKYSHIYKHLKSIGIHYIGQLIQHTEKELLSKNLSKADLYFIREKLRGKNLFFDTEVAGITKIGKNNYFCFYEDLNDIGLSSHIVKILNKNDIFYIGDLIQLNTSAIISMPGIGKKTVSKIKKALDKNCLSLSITLRKWGRPEH